MLDRRQFLTRSGAAAAAAGALGAAHASEADAAARRARTHDGSQDPLQTDGPLQDAVASDPAAHLPAVSFHGPWQAVSG